MLSNNNLRIIVFREVSGEEGLRTPTVELTVLATLRIASASHGLLVRFDMRRATLVKT